MKGKRNPPVIRLRLPSRKRKKGKRGGGKRKEEMGRQTDPRSLAFSGGKGRKEKIRKKKKGRRDIRPFVQFPLQPRKKRKGDKEKGRGEKVKAQPPLLRCGGEKKEKYEKTPSPWERKKNGKEGGETPISYVFYLNPSLNYTRKKKIREKKEATRSSFPTF